VDPKLYPLEPLPWTPKHYYIPSAPSQINRLLASLEKSMTHVETLDLAGLLARANKLIEAGDRVASNISQIDFKQLGTNADGLIADFRDTARRLQQTLSDAQSAINGADLPAISRDARALVAKLSTVSLELRRVLAGVDTGELNRALEDLRTAADEAVVLIHDLEQRPSSLFFSKYPNPVPELEKPPRR